MRAEAAWLVSTFIAWNWGMKHRRLTRDRFQRMYRRRQCLIFHVYEIKRLLHGVTVGGGDGRDLLADISHAILRQHGFIQQAYTFQPRQNLFSVKYGFYTAKSLHLETIVLLISSVMHT